MEIRKLYDKRLRVSIGDFGKTMTHQSFKDECDINNILRRYEQSGVLPSMRDEVQAHYGDYSDVASYQEALNIVINAQQAFDSLDAATRDRFANDPVKFVAFCQDKANREEAIKLGLIAKVDGDVKPEVPSPNAEAPKVEAPKA